MSITLLYGCAQIELVVRDLDAARSFLEQVLGAAPIEQDFARDLGTLLPDGYRIDHVDCGQATWQLNEAPAVPGAGVHAEYLARIGPCVTNLNYYVDDVVHAREVFAARGAETLMEGPSTIVKSLADYGPDNTRPGGTERPFLFMGTRPLLGFDFELMEPNFVHFVEQTTQVPCFVGDRPGNGVAGLRLRRLTVAVPDLADTYRNLVDLFTPGSRSNPYAVRHGADAEAFRITLGGIELEYCQPRRSDGAVAEHLDHYGRGVIQAEFRVPSLDAVLERIPADAPWPVTDAVDLLGEESPQLRRRIACRDVVGFDVLLEEQRRQR